MADKAEVQQSLPIQINTADEMSRGRYSNLLLVSHGQEDFFLDWILNSPNGPHLVSRIIVTPANIKRIIETLNLNLQQYEAKFGAVHMTDASEQKVH